MIKDHLKNLGKITYLILIERSEVSHFNQYEKLKITQQDIIKHILTLPKDIYEIYMNKEKIVYQRSKGLMDGYDINYIYDINEIEKYSTSTKCIIVSKLEDIEKIGEQIKIPIIFLSKNLNTNESINLYNLTSLNVQKFQTIFDGLLKYHDSKAQKEFLEIKNYSIAEKTEEYENLNDLLTNHLYTSSNLSTLESMRVKFSWEQENEIEEKNIVYPIYIIKHITRYIEDKVDNHIPIKPIYQYLLSDISYNLDFSLNPKEYTKFSLKNKNIDNIDDFITTYKLIKSNNLLNDTNISNSYTEEYNNERLYIENLIAIQTSSFCIPNIKLSIHNDKYKALLKEIGNYSRDNHQNIHQSFLKLEEQLSKDIGDRFVFIKNDYSVELKLVSNLPLEWCPQDNLPLMIKNEVSRIPISFGNVAEKLLMDTEQIYLLPNAFSKILFITSFKDDDPIKYHLRNSISTIKEYNFKDKEYKIFESNDILKGIDFSKVSFDKKLEIQEIWEDISNIDELISTLNKNTSPIIVFDLHGGHNEKEEGVIFIKGKAVPISKLFGKVKIPPIVILSSCDTNPLDRNHYNTANAFLLMGAKTVLASAVPIQSREASIFISRLLMRLSIFLPIRLFNVKQNIRWSELITGMTRQMYYTELIFKLRNKYNFKDELVNELGLFVNLHINPLQANFNKKIIEQISLKIGISNEIMNKFIKEDFKFPESLKYIQMGNPELITIATEENMIESFKN